MKTRVSIILLIFISILVSCEESKSSKSKVNHVGEQYSEMISIFNSCDLDILSFTEDYENYCLKNIYNYKPENYIEDHENCLKQIKSFSCEDIEVIKTIEDLQNITTCFNFPLITKKQSCINNQDSFCEQIFNSCGEDKLIGICEDSLETWGSEESPEHDFNKEMLDNYCDSTVDKDQKITDQFDLFIYQCENYSIDCDNIQMLDFRYPEWKNSCSE